MRNKILWSIVFCALVDFAFAIAGKTNNNWKKVDGKADGEWGDVLHWTLGMPDASHYAYFPGGLGSYTVTFPEGDVEVATSFRANVAAGETLTLDGRGSNFRQGARETDTYHHEPFGFRYGAQHFFNHQQYGLGDSTIARHAFSEMTNFVVRLSGVDSSPKLYFDQGYLNLYDPCGASPWGAYTMLFAQGATANSGPYQGTGIISFGKNTHTRFGQVYLQGNSRTNILEFTGGKHEFFSQFASPNASQSMVDDETFTQIRIADDAEAFFYGALWFGDINSTYGDTARRKFELLVENGGYCVLTNAIAQRTAGTLRLAANNGGILELLGGATLAPLEACTTEVSVVNATLSISNNFALGGKGHNGRFVSTNATIKVLTRFDQISSIAELVDSKLTTSDKFIFSGDSSAIFSGDKAQSSFTKPFYLGNTATSDNEVEFAGGKHDFTGSIYIGQLGRGRLKISGGTFNNLSGEGSAFAYFGVENSALGELLVEGGIFNAPGYQGIQAGFRGLGKVSVTGGEIKTQRIRLGSFDSTVENEDIFEQSGGLVDLSGYENEYLYAAIYSKRKARVSLTGGVLKCGRIAAGAGVANFYADGGKIEVPAANANFFYGFNLAELGSKGLEIFSEYDITAAQAFTKSKNGGKLILGGSGTKRFTAAETLLDNVVVNGGKAVFPGGVAGLGKVEVKGDGVLAFDGDIGDNVIGSLVLGDEKGPGVLEIQSGKKLKVAGDVVVNCAKIIVPQDFVAGEDYPIVEFAGNMSEQSRKRLAATLAHGLQLGDVAEFSLSEDSASAEIIMTLRKRSDLTIKLEAGQSNATENITFALGEQLTVDVGEQASLNLQGTYGVGKLLKEGRGKAYIAGNDSEFAGGVLVAGGLLSVADPSALWNEANPQSCPTILSNGTLEVVGPAEGVRIAKALALVSAPTNMIYVNNAQYKGRAAVIVKNEVPLTMPAPSPALAAFMKRGVAPMTIEAEGQVDFPSERGHDIFGFTPTSTEYVFDEFGNIPENCVYPAVSIVEGELKLKGIGDEPAQFDIYGSLMLAVPTKSVAVQPSLVLDNAKLVNKSSGTRAYLGYWSKNNNSAVEEVRLVLTNNSVFAGDTVYVNYNAGIGAKARIDAHSSKFIATYQLNAGYGTSSDIVYSFAAGSELLAERFSLNKTLTMNFDSSRCAKDENLNAVGIIIYDSAPSQFNFRNSSEFICNSIKLSSTTTGALTLLFNDSKWMPGSGDFDFAAAVTNVVSVVAEGRGLVLDVPANKTWTMNLPISGSGGMVASGKGKVVLDASKWAAEGVAEVEADATLDLGGGEAQGLYVAGAGTVENGTISGGGIAVCVDAEGANRLEGTPLLRNIDFAGRVSVKLEIDEGVLSEPYRPIAVARYEGEAPAIGSWRMKKLSYDRTVGARFSAIDGTVYMTPSRRGTTIIVR